MDCQNMFSVNEVVLFMLGLSMLWGIFALWAVDYIIRAMNNVARSRFGKPVYEDKVFNRRN